ncbi:hypothetical protein SAMN05444817_1095 [Corynebacterium appendicis CIP 107643]|uniref:Uncharacterized protein n=1 Tax=Corynebacterium appendicis CIP 107643 TaxID=1161099 RepID=A0A1N7JK32_9CORY|nr:hypothetical protein CAPP_08770 [Corynebacterium appendicis CIP 107643]SIS49621.1 hypothetical protein SAMN05444817_1095 [Corynebacterium appendicis CIP 107643]
MHDWFCRCLIWVKVPCGTPAYRAGTADNGTEDHTREGAVAKLGQ